MSNQFFHKKLGLLTLFYWIPINAFGEDVLGMSVADLMIEIQLYIVTLGVTMTEKFSLLWL